MIRRTENSQIVLEPSNPAKAMMKAVGKAMVAMEMGGRQLVPTVDVQLVAAGEDDRTGNARKTSEIGISAFEWT